MLLDAYYEEGDTKITNLEISVEPVEDQTEAMVMKEWKPLSFTEKELRI